jgi:RNA polymerase sigma-70 factor (ECF subfamily)
VESDPAQPLQSREDQQQIQIALQQLAPEFREPLLLKEFEEMKYEEIAELMQIPVGTVRSRIHRARTELRALLDRQAASSSTPAD